MKERTPAQWFEVQRAKIDAYKKLLRHLELIAADKHSETIKSLRDLTDKNIKASERAVFDLLDNPRGPDDYAKLREIWGERRANAILLSDFDSTDGKIARLQSEIAQIESAIDDKRARENVAA